MTTPDPVNHLLLFCTDEHYRKTAVPPDFSTLDVNASIRKFRNNKVSLVCLSTIANEFSKIFELPELEVNKDAESSKQWSDALAYASQLFRDYSIGHIFIKVLNPKWATMTDLDILPPTGSDQLKALEFLDKDGFDLYQFRLLAHPLKIMAKKKGNEISIDFYPKPMWMRKKVCDTEIIASRTVDSSFNGVPIVLPSPEDDLYLFGTHGYNHLRFTVAEIAHAISVLNLNKNFDWEYFTSLALDYGTSDAIFTFLKIIEIYSTKLHSKSLVDENALQEFLRIKLCRKMNQWLEKNYSESLCFPIDLPPSLACGESSFYHCKTMLTRVSLLDLSYDFLSPFLSWSSKISLGR